MSLYALYVEKAVPMIQKKRRGNFAPSSSVLDICSSKTELTLNPRISMKKLYPANRYSSRPEMLRYWNQWKRSLQECLCMDIDRSWKNQRSRHHWGNLIFNTKIITPNRQYDLNDRFDEDYAEFEGFMAHRELKMIKRRMQRNSGKPEEGGYLAMPLWFMSRQRFENGLPWQLTKTRLAFVRMIFDLYVNKGMGCQHIADPINSMGAKPHRSQNSGAPLL